jgi:ectoine hydroxylase-related dioxygenase (phytanoyl-CoA dioxygenase family)
MTASKLDILRRDGCVLLEGVIPPAEVPRIRERVAETVREHTKLPLPQGYVTGFLRVNQEIAPYLAHPRIMELVEPLFGEHARISMLTGVINGPGLPRGPWHADWPFNQDHRSRVAAPYPNVVLNLVTMWMLTDFTVENGGTIYLPGSHLRSHAPKKDAFPPCEPLPGEVRLLGKAGDVGVFDARTWHAIAPNVTGEDRVAVIPRYAPWWLNLNPLRPGTRDRWEIVESAGAVDITVEPIPEEVYRGLPEAVQRLVYHMVETGAVTGER